MHVFTLLRVFAVASLALAPAAGYAANADQPYSNIDRSNDRGNETGDSRVDGLNSAQLNQNYRGPAELRAPANPPAGPSTVVITPR